MFYFYVFEEETIIKFNKFDDTLLDFAVLDNSTGTIPVGNLATDTVGHLIMMRLILTF